MRLLVELSGEQPALARAEALAALETADPRRRLLPDEPRVVAAETCADPSWLARRLGLAHCVSELLASGSLEEMLDAAKSLDFAGRTFRARANLLRGGRDRADLERRIGDVVTGRVDLAAPDEEVRLVEGERCYLGRRLAAIDRSAFESRKVAFRPMNHPISLHPRLARALVNLARVPDGGVLLDPFCGTGGIVLEAALVGARVVGGDIREDMIAGTRALLDRHGLAADLHATDVGGIPDRVGQVDAVATDPPYGRATSTRGEPLAALYRRTVDVVERVLREGGHFAMVAPDPSLAAMTESFGPVAFYPMRVHRSLTRYFLVTRLEGRCSAPR